MLPVLFEDEDGRRAFNLLLCVADARDQIVHLVDERRNEFSLVDLARAHRHELMPVVGKIVVHQLFGIVDDAHRRNRIQPEVGTHQKRLRVGVADAADAAAPVKIAQVVFKLGAERGIGNIVNLALKPGFGIVNHHTAAFRSQMGMIIHSEKNV